MSQFIKLREVIKIQLSRFSIFKRVENLLREKGSLFTDFKQMNLILTLTTAATLLAKLRVLETRKHSKEAYLALFLAGYTLNLNLKLEMMDYFCKLCKLSFAVEFLIVLDK